MDVRTLCLAVLTHGDMTGYEIKKHFEHTFSHFFVAGYGSIYPALAELGERGLVTCTEVAQDGRPDKKVYHLTAAGLAEARAALAAAEPRHKVRSEFLVLLYFAHLLPRERLAAILEARERDIEAQLAKIEQIDACAEDSGVPSIRLVADLGRATLATQLAYLRAHRDEFLAVTAAPAAAGAVL